MNERQTLTEWLASRETVSATDAATIVVALAEALRPLHDAGRAHGDLCPDRVSLSRKEVPSELALDAPLATWPSVWAAPEQFDPTERPRPAADVWSLGLLAFRLLTGRSYWTFAPDAPTRSEIRETILGGRIEPASRRASHLGVATPLPEGFDAWFARCVAPDPRARFRDAGALIAALAWSVPSRIATVAVEPSRPPSPPVASPSPSPPVVVSVPVAGPFGAPRQAPPRRRPRVPLFVALGALVALGTFATLALSRRPPPPRPAVHRPPLAIDLASGDGHTCAVFADGSLRCWGANNRGQLGGRALLPGVPVRIARVPRAARVALGEEHSCAVLADGTVRCWGRNNSGQLGAPVGDESERPVAVRGLSGARDLALGTYHSCALMADQTARCWGTNVHGQLGDGTADPRGTHVAAIDQAELQQLAAGDSDTCAVRSGGTVHCWGAGYGTGPGAGPQEVRGLTEVVQVSVGHGDTCARRHDGTVHCWSAQRC